MIRLTNSEAKNWRRCKRKWYLSQYRGLDRRAKDFNKPLSIGSRLHDVLQHYYVPGLYRGDVMEYFRAGVEADVEEFPARESDIRKEADLVDSMLTGYFQWLEEEGADAELEVIEAEAEMEQPLIDGATILSKIDARVRRVSDDHVLSLEHKTVGSLTDPVRRLQVDTQLLTEHLVEFLHQLAEGTPAEDVPAKGSLYNMLKKSKRTSRARPPFFAREEVHHNQAELRHHWRHMAGVAREIIEVREKLDAGADHHDVCYPNPTKECTWDCEFRELCLPGLMDDGSDPEPMIQDLYSVGDPLERYRTSVGLPTTEEQAA